MSSTDLARSEGKLTEGPAIARDLKAIGVEPVSGPGVDEVTSILFRWSDLANDEPERARDGRWKPEVRIQRETGRQRVDRALGHVTARWGGEAVRRRNTLTFPAAGRLVHAVAGTRVSLVGWFTFHVEPATYARLVASPDR